MLAGLHLGLGRWRFGLYCRCRNALSGCRCGALGGSVAPAAAAAFFLIFFRLLLFFGLCDLLTLDGARAKELEETGLDGVRDERDIGKLELRVTFGHAKHPALERGHVLDDFLLLRVDGRVLGLSDAGWCL